MDAHRRRLHVVQTPTSRRSAPTPLCVDWRLAGKATSRTVMSAWEIIGAKKELGEKGLNGNYRVGGVFRLLYRMRNSCAPLI